MWSAALDVILTTLRYLAPATLLTVFFGHQSFLFKLLKSIDSTFRAIVFSSEEQKKSVLKWIAEAGPVKVEHLDTVWRHGWILCGVLDAALPGACAGHPPTRLSLKHAQAIADHYLGVEPVFSRHELDSNDSLSKHQEWKLATYLDRIRQALAKLTPPVSKPTSQRTSPETTQFTLDYVAKGSGLVAAQMCNKMYFKIYPTAQQSLDPGEITILIRGPKDTYGMTVLPPILGKAQLIRQKLLGLQTKATYTENALPLTQGATYLRTFGRNDMNKTYYIPKTKYDIDIDVEKRPDHAKIGYFVNLEGKYVISITSRGQNIIGSPFSVTASNNIIELLEKDSFCLEDGEEIGIVDVKTDRKVVLRIVDFVTEKMLLKENGYLEHISDEEAKILMSTDNKNTEPSQLESCFISSTTDDENQSLHVSSTTTDDHTSLKIKKFITAIKKIITMNRVCKILISLVVEKKSLLITKEERNTHIQQKDVPDIVNSTFSDTNLNTYLLSDKRDKYLIPESISITLRTEKPKSIHEEEIINTPINADSLFQSSICDYTELGDIHQHKLIDKNVMLQSIQMSGSNTSNPFLSNINKHNIDCMNTFVSTEYETNNSQSEEIQNAPMKILIEKESQTLGNNPFTRPDIILERPKTPLLKIISEDVKDREGSVYVDSRAERNVEETYTNEFVNPFFMHQLQQTCENEERYVTDFIIGAPVSLPPIIRTASPDPEMESILLFTSNNDNFKATEIKHLRKESEIIENEILPPIFAIPTEANTKLQSTKQTSESENTSNSSNFHSMDSNLTETTDDLTSTAIKNKENASNIKSFQSSQIITPRRDTWDSAYVSIDDNNSSSDSNNNESSSLTETNNKQYPSDSNYRLKLDDLSAMGPAEKELWRTCSELKDATPKTLEDIKPAKIKRSAFTPIIEESDRSISSGMKDSQLETYSVLENDPVTMAFAELNEMYQEYYPHSESSSINLMNCSHEREQVTLPNTNVIHVDSASDKESDVKRHVRETEGTISEVQSIATESVSVSRDLHAEQKKAYEPVNLYKSETQFGDRTNIVLEKKKYWDEKIRQIEEIRTEEFKSQQKKKRLSSKHLKHNDSLSKRKGKQIVKNFLKAGGNDPTTTIIRNETEIIKKEATPHISAHTIERAKPVEKWKKYWDDKLEPVKADADTVNLRAKSPKTKEYLSPQHNLNLLIHKVEAPTLPVKHELPEEVFKAFETSPKRFFGTSRKQILNKIDAFLGKENTADECCTVTHGESHESGLVSSRITLFHNITQTEPLPRPQRKSKSLHNIYERKQDIKSTISLDESILNEGHIINQSEVSSPCKKSTKVMETKTNLRKVENASFLKDKKAQFTQKLHDKGCDGSTQHTSDTSKDESVRTQKYIKNIMKEINKQSDHSQKYKKSNVLSKTSISKSEMDIFNKITNKPDCDDLDKHKSYDELPKINVKSFISLYENVSKSLISLSKSSPTGSRKNLRHLSSKSGAENEPDRMVIPSTSQSRPNIEVTTDSPTPPPRRKKLTKTVQSESTDRSLDNETSIDSTDTEIVSLQDYKETTYLSLSDIELEIVENKSENSTTPLPERDAEIAHTDYKYRFKKAKQYFQSLEELRTESPKKSTKLNECEILLSNESNKLNESPLNYNRPQKRVKKNIKSHSMPSSEISKLWKQMQQENEANSSESGLVKISEKFNVEDLFSDVTEGKLSRQGSLRGVPHKKAVLETFRSMENVSDHSLNSYEIAVSQLNEFAKNNQIKNAQTYLTEYPYLPTTAPSKYHSRLDTKATGLISMKELLYSKPRRNSVPDLQLNTKFTADL